MSSTSADYTPTAHATTSKINHVASDKFAVASRGRDCTTVAANLVQLERLHLPHQIVVIVVQIEQSLLRVNATKLASRVEANGRRQLLLILGDVVNEVTAGSVGTEALRVERLAQVGLVLGMTTHVLELAQAMRELTLLAVLALTVLAVLSTHLGLVAAVVDLLVDLALITTSFSSLRICGVCLLMMRR
jgi:hypothetical protein